MLPQAAALWQPHRKEKNGAGSDNNSPPLCFIHGKCSHLVKVKFAQQEAREWDLAFLAGREEPLEDTNSIMSDLNGFVS